MIRSIFIGFLILSTLTTKGAEAQIAASTNISAVALRDLISAASACAEKAGGTSCESSRIINCSSFESINSHILSLNNNSNEVFIVALPSDGNLFLARGEGIQDFAALPTDKGMYCCKSGLSPPY